MTFPSWSCINWGIKLAQSQLYPSIPCSYKNSPGVILRLGFPPFLPVFLCKKASRSQSWRHFYCSTRSGTFLLMRILVNGTLIVMHKGKNSLNNKIILCLPSNFNFSLFFVRKPEFNGAQLRGYIFLSVRVFNLKNFSFE